MQKYHVSIILALISSISLRDQLIERGSGIFETAPDSEVKELKSKVSKLEQMIGKKELELSLLKNFSDFYSSQNQT